MGKNFTVSLTTEEEKKIMKLVDRGDFRSVYAFIKRAVRRALDGYKN